jgi:hypothetical protein
MVLDVCEAWWDPNVASGDTWYIQCGRDLGVVSRVVSSRTIWCPAYLYSECYAFPDSLVYAVTHRRCSRASISMEVAACIAANHYQKEPVTLRHYYQNQNQSHIANPMHEYRDTTDTPDRVRLQG